MPQTRFDIKDDDVLKMLEDTEKYPSIASIANKLGCSRSVIRRIRDGTRNEPRVIKTKKSKLCECCGVRKKKPGFRYLCNQCFRTKGYLNEVNGGAAVVERIHKYRTRGSE